MAELITGGLIWLGIALCFLGGSIVYFIPSVIAISYNRKQAPAIIVLNLVLGCTFIGWVVALVWACVEDR